MRCSNQSSSDTSICSIRISTIFFFSRRLFPGNPCYYTFFVNRAPAMVNFFVFEPCLRMGCTDHHTHPQQSDCSTFTHFRPPTSAQVTFHASYKEPCPISQPWSPYILTLLEWSTIQTVVSCRFRVVVVGYIYSRPHPELFPLMYVFTPRTRLLISPVYHHQAWFLSDAPTSLVEKMKVCIIDVACKNRGWGKR